MSIQINDFQVIYENEKMIVCNKPTGMLAQSTNSFDIDMVSALMTYRKKKGEDTFIGVINRLDRQVSGIMVFAKTKEEAARLNKLMQQNSFDKQYYAVICGKPEEDKGTFVDYLKKDARKNISEVVSKDTLGAKRAELSYEVVKSIIHQATRETFTLVKINLITGRHHQIRVQFASRGLALVGDYKYSTGHTHIDDSKGIALCAYALHIGKQNFEIEPDDSVFKLFE